ncbi:MAG: FAD-dependent oxidoreductase [Lachnospiraceae bacterium]|nr:FAD-dependent oxidoreductase [Lachnospiraceae bacterium]
MGKIYDLIIIGAGPAGLTAAIYAQRAGLDAVVLEKNGIGGGQLLNTDTIENYPGIMGVTGYELSQLFREHADAVGAKIIGAEVTGVRSLRGNLIEVSAGGNTPFVGRTLLVAVGVDHRRLNVPGEAKLMGKGVSFCAVCDGPLFRGKTVAVVGGGNVAAEEALYLSGICERVYLIHRRGTLKADKVLADRILSTPNIEPFWYCQVSAINGASRIENIHVDDTNEMKRYEIPVDALFIAIGMEPDRRAYQGICKLDPSGFIIADESCCTSAPNVFAAGDIRTKQLRQIVCSAADGAVAIDSIKRYLNTLGE